jgi:hypothetical protein
MLLVPIGMLGGGLVSVISLLVLFIRAQGI